jgi:hypothetical protein
VFLLFQPSKNSTERSDDPTAIGGPGLPFLSPVVTKISLRSLCSTEIVIEADPAKLKLSSPADEKWLTSDIGTHTIFSIIKRSLPALSSPARMHLCLNADLFSG